MNDDANDTMSEDTRQGWYLTPSHLLEYLYCPRFTYYEFVLGIPEFQEKRFKVQRGRQVHEERQRVNPGYLRKKLGVVRREHDVPVHSGKHHLKGRVDEVLWLDDGSIAPFDYKYAEWKGRIYINQKVQAALYGIMLQGVYELPAKRAFLCYTRSRFHIEEIPLDEAAYDRAMQAVHDCLDVIQTGVYPPPTKSKGRCPDCCYRNVCLM